MDAPLQLYYGKYYADDGTPLFKFCPWCLPPLAPADPSAWPTSTWFYYETIPHRLLDASARHGLDSDGVARVLEVGCGRGGALPIITSRLPNANVVAGDIVPAHLTAAQAGLPAWADAATRQRVEFAQLDISSDLTPLPGQKFDLILSISVVIYHVSRKKQWLKVASANLSQLLAPRGLIILYEYTTHKRLGAHLKCMCEAGNFEVVEVVDLASDVVRGAKLNFLHQFGYDLETAERAPECGALFAGDDDHVEMEAYLAMELGCWQFKASKLARFHRYFAIVLRHRQCE